MSNQPGAAFLNSQILLRMQDRLEAVLDGMPVGVSWADLRDQRILFLNRKFRDLFGYRLGDHATVSDWIRHSYPKPEQVARAMDMWGPHFKTQAIVPVEIPQVEVDVRCKDGGIKTTLLSGMILPQEGWALAIFNDITERKEAERRIQRQASEDPLTGLNNRRAFDEALARGFRQARQRKESLAMLLVDLDDFKALNDTLGHASGDRVLQVVADRLRRAVRDQDMVCRLGGDEFVVLLEGPDAARLAPEIADRMLAEIAKPYDLDGQLIDLHLSIGIAVYPRDAEDAQSLYRNADKALYRAKEQTRRCWSL